MNKELEALESAIVNLEMLFRSIEFNDKIEALDIATRLQRAHHRLMDLVDLCFPEE